MKFTPVAKTDDLQDGEMRGVKVDDTDVLLCRIGGEYSAVGAFCPHYGAPLEMGVLSGDRIVCPWHHACFNARTGALEEPPARDALTPFQVKVEGDEVLVALPEESEGERLPAMSTFAPQTDGQSFAIIGGGAAGNAAAQALRESDFQGRVAMITQENRLPYDRPNLSKDYLQGNADEDWMPLRSQEFYKKYGIEVSMGKKVTSLDAGSKTVVFDNGETEQFDSVLVATGGKAKTMNVPGAGLENVFTLRSFDDSDEIIAAAENASRVVVVGASFIGMETAFSLAERDLAVTVVAPETVPFEKSLGKEIGALFQKLHEENGIKFRLGCSVAKFSGNGRVQEVLLESGDTIKTDMVIVGVGVVPATDFLHGLDLHSDGALNVDEHFRAARDIYAAGDIARFPDWHTGERVRIEHWRTAEQQGRIAGRNMAGDEVPFRSVPFFWTTQAGLHFRYVGHAEDWDEIITQGDIADHDFISFYVKDDLVHAAGGNGRDEDMAAVEELMRLKKMPGPDELRNGNTNLASFLS